MFVRPTNEQPNVDEQPSWEIGLGLATHIGSSPKVNRFIFNDIQNCIFIPIMGPMLASSMVNVLRAIYIFTWLSPNLLYLWIFLHSSQDFSVVADTLPAHCANTEQHCMYCWSHSWQRRQLQRGKGHSSRWAIAGILGSSLWSLSCIWADTLVYTLCKALLHPPFFFFFWNYKLNQNALSAEWMQPRLGIKQA